MARLGKDWQSAASTPTLSRRDLIRVGGLGLLGALGPRASAAPTEALRVANTRHDREAAIRAIPFDKLTDEAGARIRTVVRNPTIFRSMPVEVVACHRELFLCLVRNPEIVVGIWSVMGITTLKVTRTGPFTYNADDGAGTTSDLELVYGTPTTHIIYATGNYQGPLLGRRLRGNCVMVLNSGYVKAEDQSDYVTNQLDVFLQIENIGADLLARTIHPLVGKTADNNFAESTRFLGQIHYAAQKRPEKLDSMIRQLDEIDPQVLAQFNRVARLVRGAE